MLRWRRHPAATLVYGLFCSIIVALALAAASSDRTGPHAFNGMLAATATVYALLISRPRGLPWIARGFAVAALGVLPWLSSPSAGIVLAATVNGWIRTSAGGLRGRRRAAAAELVGLAAAAGLALAYTPGRTMVTVLGIWMFYLVQGVILTLSASPVREHDRVAARARFEAAMRKAEDILRSDTLGEM